MSASWGRCAARGTMCRVPQTFEMLSNAPHQSQREPEIALLGHGHEAAARDAHDDETDEPHRSALAEALHLGNEARGAGKAPEAAQRVDPEGEDEDRPDDSEIHVDLQVRVVRM